MPTEKIASSRVTTVSEPFRLSRTSTGSRASTTAPTSQNQLTMSEPRHRRVSGIEVTQQGPRWNGRRWDRS